MQIIEQTDLGVRSAVMTFERADSAVRFVVIPMMHLALPSFYREVHRRLQTCDVVIAEGVGGTRTRVITLAYRLAGRFRRGGLVQQSEALDLSKLGNEIVRPDLSAEEFATGWTAISWSVRWTVFVVVPLVALAMVVVGPLRLMGANLALDDLPSANEEDAEIEQLDRLLLDTRDQRLVAEILRQAETHRADSQPWFVGVPWGAAHVRAIAPALIGRGYQIRKAEWIKMI